MTSPATSPSLLSNLNLPIAEVADDVCTRLQQGNVVLQAEPGAGKSTGLPLALLNAGFSGKILMLEPRRLAARGVAARLAAHFGESVGQTIGLRMRGSTKVSAATRLEVVTEGVLTRILQSDPLLEGVAVVVFDEFHERSLHADLGLALCLDVQRSVRDDLRLLLMSATLDGENLSAHINAGSPVVCRVRQHPVEIIWRAQKSPLPAAAVAATVTTALKDHTGDVLVFLTGVAEINQTANLLQSQMPDNTELHRLHGSTGNDAQRAATAATTPGSPRRVILSTNLAETSITIDGVTVVIDCRLERRQRIDAGSGAERLETVMASRASATQRAGRAGRTGPGVCYRLWSQTDHATRAESWQPEILRAELSSLVCDLGLWGITDFNSLPWLDAPAPASINRAMDLLQRLQVWNNHGFTAYGRRVAQLPLHPRLCHMVLWGAERGSVKTACQLAAILEDLPRTTGCDLSSVLSRMSRSQTQRAQQLQQLQQLAMAQATCTDEAPGHAVLLARAYPDRIARRRSSHDGRYLMSSGAGAELNSEDPLAQSEWLAVARLGGSGSTLRIFAALAIDTNELKTWCCDLIETRDEVDWDDKAERVVAERQQRLGSIVLQSERLANVSDEQRQQALLKVIRKRGLKCLNITEEVLEWQARVQRARKLSEDFPCVDDSTLLQTLEHWLQPYLNNVNSLQALQKIDVSAALTALIDYSQQQTLNSLMPVKYTVPSGASHRLRYACEGSPVLAVKLQEMFGCRENPSVGGGRVPLKVELLSPARRPVQITEDLANFWTNSYPAVKKDLAGRYPKHPWPDDPLNAEPTAYTKRRKK
jgi:ATP-dependent helicase HrpB